MKNRNVISNNNFNELIIHYLDNDIVAFNNKLDNDFLSKKHKNHLGHMILTNNIVKDEIKIKFFELLESKNINLNYQELLFSTLHQTQTNIFKYLYEKNKNKLTDNNFFNTNFRIQTSYNKKNLFSQNEFFYSTALNMGLEYKKRKINKIYNIISDSLNDNCLFNMINSNAEKVEYNVFNTPELLEKIMLNTDINSNLSFLSKTKAKQNEYCFKYLDVALKMGEINEISLLYSLGFLEEWKKEYNFKNALSKGQNYNKELLNYAIEKQKSNNKINELIDFRYMVELSIKNQSFNHFNALIGKSSIKYNKDDQAGATFFSLLFNYSFNMLQKINKEEMHINQDLYELIEKGIPMMIDNYSHAKNNQLFKNDNFSKIIIWFKHYHLINAATSMEKQYLSNKITIGEHKNNVIKNRI